MADARCDCHDMLLADCDRLKGAQAREKDAAEAARRRDQDLIDRRRAFPARYAGTCGGCGERYPEGTPISKRNGDEEWRASCCLDDNGAPTR